MDCRRTDRTQPLFSNVGTPTGAYPEEEEESAQSQSNEHVDRLKEILLTYNFYEKELGTCLIIDWWSLCLYCFLGYVQGMSDLCAPIYVVCGADEASTFWCFVSVMERMVGTHILHP